MQAKANLLRTLLLLPVVLLVAEAVALFGLGIRKAETQTTTASTTTYYKVQDLSTLGGTYSTAYGINDSGQVVGYSRPTAVTIMPSSTTARCTTLALFGMVVLATPMT